LLTEEKKQQPGVKSRQAPFTIAKEWVFPIYKKASHRENTFTFSLIFNII
jgi:hypothetical protein